MLGQAVGFWSATEVPSMYTEFPLDLTPPTNEIIVELCISAVIQTHSNGHKETE